MENSNENDENDLPSIHLKMVWRKTRKSFSVRIEGRSYVYRSLSKTTKMVPLRCGYPSCNAAVKFNLESYCISVLCDKSKSESTIFSFFIMKHFVENNFQQIYRLEPKRVEISVRLQNQAEKMVF